MVVFEPGTIGLTNHNYIISKKSHMNTGLTCKHFSKNNFLEHQTETGYFYDYATQLSFNHFASLILSCLFQVLYRNIKVFPRTTFRGCLVCN